jgi:hypothetical protein
MPKDRREEKSSSITWWNAAITSTAIAIGCVLFIGHETLASRLQLFFGYQPTPFSIYSYDEVLMVGVDTIFRVLGPFFLLAALLALLIRSALSDGTRRILVTVLTIPLAGLMINPNGFWP